MRIFKRAALLVPVLAVGIIVAGVPSVAFGNRDRDEFHAQLIGLNEVPSINTQGTANVRLQLSSDKIEFDLTYANLSANPAAAHIHFGQRRTNGGVMVFFCGGGGKPACPASTSGSISGTIVATDVVGPTTQGVQPGDLAAVLRAIRSGASYANMHTANFPNGEIRGQIGRDD
jgi:hypothetical protein